MSQSRRGFLGVLAGAVAAPMVLPRSALVALPRGLVMARSTWNDVFVRYTAELIGSDFLANQFGVVAKHISEPPPLVDATPVAKNLLMRTAINNRQLFGQEGCAIAAGERSVTAEVQFEVDYPLPIDCTDVVRVHDQLFRVTQIMEVHRDEENQEQRRGAAAA